MSVKGEWGYVRTLLDGVAMRADENLPGIVSLYVAGKGHVYMSAAAARELAAQLVDSADGCERE